MAVVAPKKKAIRSNPKVDPNRPFETGYPVPLLLTLLGTT